MMQARDIMTREVFTVHPEMSVSDLAMFLQKHLINGAPVVDVSGNLLGLVTKKQLIFMDHNQEVHLPTLIGMLREICRGNIQDLDDYGMKMVNKKVEEIYLRDIITIGKDTPLEEIAILMTEKGATLLPVLHNGKLVGIVGKTDVLRAFCRKNRKSI